MKKNYEMNVDIVVAGGGPAGVCAAYEAAKNGASVVLIEQLGDLGGMSTSGMMSHWAGDCGSKLFREILRRSADLNEGERHGEIANLIDPENLKYLYLEMLSEVGVKILLYTFTEDVITEGDTVKGIVVVNKSGKTTIYAKTVIDATGDGDVAAMSGAEYILGREEDGKMQPATIMFKVGGVDYDCAVFPERFEDRITTEKGELQALAKEILPHPAGHVLLYPSTLPGIVTCNMTNCVDIDGTKAEDLTKATLVCRSQMKAIVKYLREYAPGYENCYIVSSASFVGIRETRHFKGEYAITGEDILAAKVFDDAVVQDAYFNFDVHNITGSGLDETGAQDHFEQTKGYTIPYRCLLPIKVENLLLCGRNISGTHMAHSNYRAMPICAGIGEAAGAAAAIATKKNISVREVEASDIRELIF